MLLLCASGLFVTLVAAISLFGYRIYARPVRMYEQIGSRGAPLRSDLLLPEKKGGPSPVVGWLNQLGGLLPISPGDAALTRRDLEAAGYRSANALQFYYGLRVVLCVVLLASALMMRQQITENPVLRVVLPIGSALMGYALPSFLLQRRIARRQ